MAELAGLPLLDGGIVTPNGREAMGYATGWGWQVFPLAFRGKLPLFGRAHPDDLELQRSCRGRCGRVGHGFYDATTDPALIASWWIRHPQAGVAIRTGPESGLLVVDVDTRNGGQASLAHLVADYEPIDAPEVETGGGGSHLYLAQPGGELADHLADYPGIDLQGEGRYVVAPPSLHPRGRRYRSALDAATVPAVAGRAAATPAAGDDARQVDGLVGEDRRWLSLLAGRPGRGAAASAGGSERPAPQGGLSGCLPAWAARRGVRAGP